MTDLPPWAAALEFTEDERTAIAAGIARVAEERRAAHECSEAYVGPGGRVSYQPYQRMLSADEACPTCHWRAS